MTKKISILGSTGSIGVNTLNVIDTLQDQFDIVYLSTFQNKELIIEQAKKYLKQYSYRDVANWLSEQSGRYISYVGLRHRVKLEEKRKREASNQRYLAKRYKEALEKAEKIEASSFSGRTQGICTGET